MSEKTEQRILRRMTALSVMTALIAGAGPGCGSSDSPSGTPGGDKPGSIPDPDTVPPTVVSHTPNDGDATVSVRAPIQVKFSEPVKLGAKPVTLVAGDQDLLTTATLSADATTMTIVPNSPIVTPAQIKVALGDISDIRGNRVVPTAPWTWSAPLWLGVGDPLQGAGYATTSIAVGPGERVSTATLYQNSPEPARIVVHSIEGSSGKWTALGDAVDVDSRQPPEIAVDPKGALVMAFNPTTPEKIGRVRRWPGTKWDAVGNDFGPTRPEGSRGFRLAASGAEKTFVAYETPDANSTAGHVVVRSIAPDSGLLGTTVDQAEDGAGYLYSLAMDKNGVPYVAYYTSSLELRVRSWSGSAWVPVGASLGKMIASGDLAFDSAGTLFALVSFAQSSGPSATRLFRFDGSNWQTVGKDLSAGTCMGPYCGRSYLSPARDGHVVAFTQLMGAAPGAFEATKDGWTPIALPPGNSSGAQACSRDPDGTVVMAEIAADGTKINVHRLNR